MSALAILIHKDVDTVNCFWQKDLTNFELLKYEVQSHLNIKQKKSKWRGIHSNENILLTFKVHSGAFVNNAFTAQEDQSNFTHFYCYFLQDTSFVHQIFLFLSMKITTHFQSYLVIFSHIFLTGNLKISNSRIQFCGVLSLPRALARGD